MRRRLSVGVLTMTIAAAGATVLPGGAAEHTVAPGDVLSTIAADHAVSVDTLIELNDLTDPDLIYVGQVIDLPGTEGADAAAAATHTVEAGDSLWAIAHLHQLTVDVLATLNAIENPALIRIGQIIDLPGHTAAADDAPSSDTDEASDNGSDTGQAGDDDMVTVHEVVPGDTLSAIAEAHGVDLDIVLSGNGLDRDSVIVPGQQIVIAVALAELDPDDLADLPQDLLSDPERLALLPVFDRWADHYGVPAELAKALAWFESGWNNEVVSSANAIGIGQVLPITADFVSEVLLGERLDPTIPEHNIRLSIRYLRYLLDETDDIRLAIASYYQGLTATRRHGIYSSSEFYVDGILALRSRFD